MSSWGPKLEKKLKALADGASKESLQTLANWVVFNRKQAAVLANTLAEAIIATDNDTRQWLYWQVVHEVLMTNRDNPEKWERASEMRSTIGENAILAALGGLSNRAVVDKIDGLYKEWFEKNVFGGPTLIGQIERALESCKAKKEGDSATVGCWTPVSLFGTWSTTVLAAARCAMSCCLREKNNPIKYPIDAPIGDCFSASVNRGSVSTSFGLAIPTVAAVLAL